MDRSFYTSLRPVTSYTLRLLWFTSYVLPRIIFPYLYLTSGPSTVSETTTSQSTRMITQTARLKMLESDKSRHSLGLPVIVVSLKGWQWLKILASQVVQTAKVCKQIFSFIKICGTAVCNDLRDLILPGIAV